MCGVFGYISDDRQTIDLDTLKQIALETETRGRHAWGLAWIDSAGRLKTFRQTGKISSQLGLLSMARDAVALIGHCRFATHGSPQHNINNHPHPCDGGWIVHNGVIRNYHDLIAGHGLIPTSECDSEVIGLLIERTTGCIVDRCAEALEYIAPGPLAVLGLWKTDMVLARRGNPLHRGRTKQGHYFASLPGSLPGKVQPLTDNQLIHYKV